MSEPVSPQRGRIRFHDWEFDARTAELRGNGTCFRVQEKSAQLLAVLLERAGEVVTREELQERLWPGGTFVDYQQGLANAVQKIREALGDAAHSPIYIETLPKRGYRFIAPVRVEGSECARARVPPLAAPERRMRAWVAAAAALIVAAGAGVWAWQLKARAPAVAAFVRVAVLPFENATGEDASNFLADGLTEEVITQLGRMDPQRIGVVARTTVMAQKSRTKAAHQAAREINAQYFVEGTLRRAGARLRVSVRLVRAGDQLQVWSGSYERDAASFLGADRSIAASLALSMASALNGAGRAQKPATLDAQALRAYRIGRFLLDRKTPESIRQSLPLFQDAIAKDQNFALAWAGLAEAIHFSGAVGTLPQQEAYRRATEAARRALEADESCGEALAVLAETNFRFGPNGPEVEGWFRNAVDLTPESSTARHWYGNFLGLNGRVADGIAHLERAHAMDPLELHLRADLAGWYYEAGQPQRAEDDLRQMIALKPAFPKPHYLLASLHAREKRWTEAIDGFRKTIALSPETPKYLVRLAETQLQAGRGADAAQTLRELQEMAKRRHVEPAMLAGLQTKLSESARRASGGA